MSRDLADLARFASCRNSLGQPIFTRADIMRAHGITAYRLDKIAADRGIEPIARRAKIGFIFTLDQAVAFDPAGNTPTVWDALL